MKKVWVGVAAAGLILGASVTAFAASVKGDIPLLHTAGVEFRGGEYKFNEPGTNHGAFEWWGRLKDKYPNDGHNVYVQVRVEGHGWARYYGKQRATVSMHHADWDGAQRYTDNAEIRVCRDRGSLRPDNCSPTQKYAYRRD
ncbi:hypothetical protein ACWD26_24565 [Streptomyces sp. NPDC002787]